MDNSQVSEKLEKLQINDNNSAYLQNGDGSSISPWGLPLAEVYKLALGFYKEKEGKAVQFSYEDKLQLIAYSQQVLHGPLAEAANKLPPLGALDVVGKDRRMAWQKLGNLSNEKAKAGFVDLLSKKCTLFTAYIEAHRREKIEQERRATEEAERKLIEEQKKLQDDEEAKQRHEEEQKEEAIKRQIQQALNEQTYEQFRQYAEQQFPGEPERQSSLVRQLQEQHYIQYMQQLHSLPQNIQMSGVGNSVKESAVNNGEQDGGIGTLEITDIDVNAEDEIPAPASMWTRTDIQTFKQAVAQAEGDGVVRVGHGETVTVRVPTHREGTRLFWEFATDHYDIGFGVYFEWGEPTSDQVSVHVSESEDEDEGDEDLSDEDGLNLGDAEAGPGGHHVLSSSGSGKPEKLLSEIVPVFRRDCQTEVYAGSHKYPGQGVYLLKFDNSYSLWRSKTLYYRVYYTN